MKWVPKGLVWRSALVLLGLLFLAAMASKTTVSFLETHPALQDQPGALRIISLMLLALSMGFLFLAGALGIAGIRYAMEIEGRRRVGRFVDAMDYLSDGILIVDLKGTVVGSNATARLLGSHQKPEQSSLQDLFPCVTDADLALLLDTARPQEVECTQRDTQGLSTLRFRSEPSEGVNLILISDVTDQKARDMRLRLEAHLQLIGRIARGVAQDFNNILCAISAHVALLEHRGARDETTAPTSMTAIKADAQRGAALARQLLDVSRVGSSGAPSERLGEHAEKAAELLRVGLPSSWKVVTDVVGSFPAVPFSGLQLEQFVLNLGLLAAEEASDTGVIHVQVRRPSGAGQDPGPGPFAAEILISVEEGTGVADESRWMPIDETSLETGGVIQSVLRSTLEEIGGRLDVFITPNHRRAFRVCVPPAKGSHLGSGGLAGVPEELKPYLARWSVLLACPHHENRDELARRFRSVGMKVESADDIVSALSRIENEHSYTGIIVDDNLLGVEITGLLRAVLKLQPTAGVVVLDRSSDPVSAGLEAEVVFEPAAASPEDILQALIRARELAGQRARAA